MSDHPPVIDWATDFDHTDEAYVVDPVPIWDDIRASSCPVARTERYGRAWLPTRHADVAAIAYDTEHFSSRGVLMSDLRPPADLAPVGQAPPISSDPPHHQHARRLLLAPFAPAAVARLEGLTRQYCDELLAAMVDRSVVDAAEEYAQHIPVRVIAKLLGFPETDGELFRGFINDTLGAVALPEEERLAGFGRLLAYLGTQVRDHIEHPRDDLTGLLLNSEIDGVPIDVDQVVGTMVLLLVAGIDTTWSAIGSSIFHLASVPADRERLVAEPELLPTAIEEFLRAYAPVTMARLVTQDIDFNGCPMRADDWVLLPFPAANRDPDAFEDADRVIIDRETNRHAAFGLGVHRCIGSHLARMELRVALAAWLEHFPSFHLADPDAVSWSSGQVRGPRTLPIRIDPR